MKRIQPITILLAALAVVFSGGLYIVSQQVLRQGANDPQIQIAEDAATRLAKGQTIDLSGATQVDAASSLAPFLILYDKSGKLAGSNGQLHGQTPVIPSSVLDYTKKHHEDRITWQPESGVRLAAVVVAANNDKGYALAARNLGEVEKRENNVMLEALAVMVASLVMIGVFALLPEHKQ